MDTSSRPCGSCVGVVRVHDDTYRCPTHGTHRCGAKCSARYVGTDGQVCCRVTGRTFHAMLALHPYKPVEHGCELRRPLPRTARTRVPSRSTAAHPSSTSLPAPFHPTKEAAHKAVARTLIVSLLYGRRRTALARMLARRAQRRIRHAVAQVSASQAKHAVAWELAHTLPLLPCPALDPTVVHQALEAVWKVWTTMATTPYVRQPKVHVRFPPCVLGCMYLFRAPGVVVGSQRYVPVLPRVAALLPPIAELHRLGLRVRDVTCGKNHIVKACRSAGAKTDVPLEGPATAPATAASPTVTPVSLSS